MSVLDSFGLGRRSLLPKNATFRLTQDGREKLNSFTGSPQSRILAALESQGTSDRDEIASASGLSRGAVERNVLILVQKGYVQRVGAGAGAGAGRYEDDATNAH